MKTLIHKIGLHPLVALGMLGVDWMLFASDLTGVGWALSCAVAAGLVIPCVLAQKYAYGDDWGTAIAKGMMVGILTAIPTPLPSVITGAGGILGLIGASKQKAME